MTVETLRKVKDCGRITAAEFEEHRLTVWQAVTDAAVAAMPPSPTMGPAIIGDLAKDPALLAGQKRPWTEVAPPKDPSVLLGSTFDDYQRVRGASIFLGYEPTCTSAGLATTAR